MIYALVISLLLSGCGYCSVEGDKHPEIMELSQLVKKETHVRYWPYMGLSDFIPLHGGYIAQGSFQGDENSYTPYSNYYFIFNKKLQEVQRYKDSGYHDTVVDATGTMYSEVYAEANSSRKVVKRSKYPYDKDETLALFEPKKLYIDHRVNAEAFNEVICTLRLDDYLLLRFKDEERVFKWYSTLVDQGVKMCPSLEFDVEKDVDVRLALTDTAVLDNSSSGNHFVFGYHQSGYQYFSLESGSKVLEFKVEVSNIDNNRNVQIRKYPRASQHDVLLEVNRRLYWVD